MAPDGRSSAFDSAAGDMYWNKRDDDKLRSLVGEGLSDAAIAKQMGVNARTVLRWRQALDMQSQWQPTYAPHGTPGRYNAGCRCSMCREGNRLRATRMREERAGREPVEHGSSGYSNWGCRCDVCSAAGAEANKRGAERARAGLIQHTRGGWSVACPCEACRAATNKWYRERNNKSRETASRNGYQWTGPELEMVDRRDLTAREIAIQLGRTIAAVQAARHRIDSGDIKTHRLLGKHMHGGRY